MRKRISSKSDTCTEGMYVYVADIGVKESAHYPERPVNLPRAAMIEKLWDELTDVSRGNNSRARKDEGPNLPAEGNID